MAIARQGAKRFSCIISLSLTAPYETGTHFTDGGLRLRDVKPLAHGHIVAKGRARTQTQGLLTLSALLIF